MLACSLALCRVLSVSGPFCRGRTGGSERFAPVREPQQRRYGPRRFCFHSGPAGAPEPWLLEGGRWRGVAASSPGFLYSQEATWSVPTQALTSRRQEGDFRVVSHRAPCRAGFGDPRQRGLPLPPSPLVQVFSDIPGSCPFRTEDYILPSLPFHCVF